MSGYSSLGNSAGCGEWPLLMREGGVRNLVGKWVAEVIRLLFHARSCVVRVCNGACVW
jgi:hypothetical protein